MIIGTIAAKKCIVTLLLFSLTTEWGSHHASSNRIRLVADAFLMAPYHYCPYRDALSLPASTNDDIPTEELKAAPTSGQFKLTTALFCGGLAFDAYVEPPPNSSRWERGSQGLNVAFCSKRFTRSLYRGLVQIKALRCEGLPEDSSTAERILTGSGTDACILVAAVEGAWKDDIERLEKTQYHEGVLELSGAAHVGRSSTAWASNSKEKSKKNGKPYHEPASWGRGGRAVWPDTEPPFYVYVQDPTTTRLVITILDRDRIGQGKAVGSTWKRLSALVPQAGYNQGRLMTELKREYIERQKQQQKSEEASSSAIALDTTYSWQGKLKMTSKPRKKDKGGQVWMATAAGAAVAGPVGAAAGALAANLYEGEVTGNVEFQLKYMPIIGSSDEKARLYKVLGGMPGINWGNLLKTYRQNHVSIANDDDFDELVLKATTSDLEHCFFVNHDRTGATCSVYRSLEQKLIVVSFRGTCEPVDLVTDASIVQEPWVAGTSISNDKVDTIPMVHTGFRGSLDSISRRLKELLLAVPDTTLEDYDMIVTGHSLGGALATLFTADIAEYGMDAGRGLPQAARSDAWWKAVADTLTGKSAQQNASNKPPRPKSLRAYTFGSPRVGNRALSELFSSLLDANDDDGKKRLDQAYRVVNGEDVVARMPRSVNALVTQVNYDHCGSTVLISSGVNGDADGNDTTNSPRVLWVEGESDDTQCPVRDGEALTSPMAEGSLLSDLLETTRDLVDGLDGDGDSLQQQDNGFFNKLTAAADKVSTRLQSVSATDVGSVLGLNRDFTEREMKIAQALLQGKALAHHMEDEYYSGMGRAVGLSARVGEEITILE